MSQLIRAQELEWDLEEILFTVAEKYSFRKAEETLEIIENRFELLGRNPYLGKERPELELGIRSYPVRPYPYMIYYRVLTDEAVQLVRLIHTSRDISRLFE